MYGGGEEDMPADERDDDSKEGGLILFVILTRVHSSITSDRRVLLSLHGPCYLIN